MSRHIAIVPAFNEADAHRSTVAAIREHAPDFDVLVVDDGSTDATAASAPRRRARACCAMPFNLGIGGAMQSGYMYALEHGYEVAVQVDGDGQHDPRHIARPARRAARDPELNMVTGSRFLAADGDGYRSSATRRVGIRVFSSVVSRDHRPARHRPDVGLSHDQPPRHRAVRARLPARLPRGRGDPADARAPPAQLRDPRRDAPALDRRLRRSPRRSRSTTWSRSCSQCSSGCSARRPIDRAAATDAAGRRGARGI